LNDDIRTSVVPNVVILTAVVINVVIPPAVVPVDTDADVVLYVSTGT
jgi:hypothetical protein